MAPHLVILRAPSSLKMVRTGHFRIDDIDAWVADWYTPSPWSGKALHEGLEYRVQVEAEKPSGAIRPALRRVELVSNLLSASHGVAVGAAQPLIAIDIDPDKPGRHFAQSFPNLPSEVRPRRSFSYDTMVAITSGRNALGQDERDAVDRALWHLRKSTRIDDLVEQFTELWIGLDALNGVIQQRYDLEKERVIRKCEACGEPVASMITNTGVKYAVEHLAEYQGSEWKELRNLRQWIFHGRPGFQPHEFDLPRLTDILRHVLMKAVSVIQGLSAETFERMLRPSLRTTEDPQLVVEGFFPGLGVDQVVLRGVPPRLRLIGVEPSTGPQGEMSVAVQDVSLRFGVEDAPKGCVLHSGYLRKYGDPEKVPVGRSVIRARTERRE